MPCGIPAAEGARVSRGRGRGCGRRCCGKAARRVRRWAPRLVACVTAKSERASREERSFRFRQPGELAGLCLRALRPGIQRSKRMASSKPARHTLPPAPAPQSAPHRTRPTRQLCRARAPRRWRAQSPLHAPPRGRAVPLPRSTCPLRHPPPLPSVQSVGWGERRGRAAIPPRHPRGPWLSPALARGCFQYRVPGAGVKPAATPHAAERRQAASREGGGHPPQSRRPLTCERAGCR